MTQPQAPTTTETFEIGMLLGESFKIVLANIVPFTAITALVLSPSVALGGYVAIVDPMAGQNPLVLLLSIFSGLLGLVATGAITYGVFQQLRGHRASLADCLGVGVRRLLPVLGVAILSGLAIMGGFCLFVIPAVIIYVMLFVAVPCVVMERPGVTNALRRSVDLTAGYRWHIFGLVVLLVLIKTIALLPLQVLLLATPNVAVVLVQGVASFFLAALSATASALVYYRLRSIKEYVHVEDIAAVFS